ncbi:ngep-related [Anaeramoeba ignava]|uniref:Ngep-related n=1 Tax=Anaeramoeba ignava TaxID=1746090 RepID=A0A9Q0LXX1_ANAIG|nr:ngep-related [Anaeramoeba ignava]
MADEEYQKLIEKPKYTKLNEPNEPINLVQIQEDDNDSDFSLESNSDKEKQKKREISKSDFEMNSDQDREDLKHIFYEVVMIFDEPKEDQGKCKKKKALSSIQKIKKKQQIILDKILEAGLKYREKISPSNANRRFVVIGTTIEKLEEWGEKLEVKLRLSSGMDEGETGHIRCQYTEFFRDQKEHFDEYVEDPPCVFPSATRQFILTEILKAKRGEGGCKINITKSLHSGVITAYFGLHDHQERNILYSQWTQKFGDRVMFRQPTDKIRDYFGENIAYYFSYLSLYSRWLIVPSIIGIILTILKYSSSSIENKFGYISLIYCLFNALWVTLFIEYWKRDSMTIASNWDLLDYKASKESDRPQFKGELRPSPIIPNSQELYYPSWKRKIKYLLSYSISFGMMAFAAFCSIRINWDKLTGKKQSTGKKYGTGIATGVVIFVLDFIYRKLVDKLNDYENHQTETSYQNSLIIKIFMFQFVNSFSSLFVIAFVKRDGKMLDSQLLSLLITRLVIQNGQEIFIPWLKGKLKMCCGSSSNATTSAMQGETERIETQTKQPVYENTIDDYSELMLQLGYISLFSVSMPVVVALAYINNLVELKVDSKKLLVMQRPIPRISIGIGSWSDVLSAVSILVVACNAALITFTYSDSFGNMIGDVSLSTRLWWFIGIEHIIFFFKFALQTVVPDETEEVKIAQAKLEYEREKYALEKQKGVFVDDFVDSDLAEENQLKKRK